MPWVTWTTAGKPLILGLKSRDPDGLPPQATMPGTLTGSESIAGRGERLGGRTVAGGRPRGSKRSASDDQSWPMLIFESLSAGMIAVLLVLAAVLVLVGIYTGVVWPITKWDLALAHSAKYRLWAERTLWLIFAAGSGLGFWYFSGAAFREKPARRAGNTQPRIPQGPSAGQGGAVPRFK
jgi:uncharacterized membrane protein YsdA (DUF1294 family)